jgi:hypothetical protein
VAGASIGQEDTMLYMLLISYNPGIARGADEAASLQPQHAKLEAELWADGRYVSGAALWPVEMRGYVVRDGESQRVDGPFAESKEVAGGYFIVECETDDEAVEIAKRVPCDSRSWIEVRRIGLFHPNVEKIAGGLRV